MSVSLGQRLIGALILLQSLVFGALSAVVPKRRGLVMVYPAFEPHRYGGNLAPVFEAMHPPPPGRRLVWLTRSAAVAADLRARGYRVHRSWGRPLFALLRAELIVLDKNEPRLGFGRFRMAQLWHGTGFKRIALETPGLSAGRLAAFRRHFRHYALIVANCAEDAARKARCFGNPHVRVLGSPRTDALVRGEGAATLAATLDLPEGKRIVAYAPTFRDSGEARPFTPAGWQALDRALGATNSVMLVKKHRFDRALTLPPGLVNVRDVSGQVPDVTRLLALTDLLVSDYSSIVTDFVLTGRPMVFFTYDADAYRSRGQRLYYDLFETLPGPFAMDEGSLLDLLSDDGWQRDPAWQARYAAFHARFHQFTDDRATQRVAAAIEDLLR